MESITTVCIDSAHCTSSIWTNGVFQTRHSPLSFHHVLHELYLDCEGGGECPSLTMKQQMSHILIAMVSYQL